MSGRGLLELLDVVGAVGGMVSDHAILNSYQAGEIDAGEARVLQNYGRRTPSQQARARAVARPITDAQIAAMRAKLNKLLPPREQP